MTDNNTVSKREYTLIHIAGALLLSWYIPYVMGLEASFTDAAFIISNVAFGYYITVEKRRNWFSFIINLLLSAELLTIIEYAGRNITLTVVLLVVWALRSAGYAALVLRSGKNHVRRKPISASRLRWSAYGSRTIFALLMVIALFSLSIFYQPPPIPTQVSADSLGCTADDCADSLSRLEPSCFDSLSQEEKLDVLRDVCRVEFTALGVDHGFSVECEELDDIILAQYLQRTYTITVNQKYINNRSSYHLLYGITHECYHAYQYSLLFSENTQGQADTEKIKEIQEIYTEELKHYCSAREDPDKYRDQAFEKDANSYADKAVVKYLRFILTDTQRSAGRAS